MTVDTRKATVLFWVVCLNLATASGSCVDLDVTGCRTNPQFCQDPFLAEVACPVMCNRCPTVLQTTTTTTMPAPAQSVDSRQCAYVLTQDCNFIPDMKRVCGTDGTTYRNNCALATAYCQDNMIHKLHDGPCTTNSTITTTAPTTPKPFDIFVF